MADFVELALNTLETVDMSQLPAVTVVCGAGFGVPFGIPTFHGVDGILQKQEMAEKVIARVSENAYVRYRDRDNALICGDVGEDGMKCEIQFRNILSNDCLNRLPAFFYSFLGNFFSARLLKETQENVRKNAGASGVYEYLDFLHFLEDYCKIKHKECRIYTLNIDGVLDAAGIKATKIHGDMGTSRCSVCGGLVGGDPSYMPRSLFSGTTKEYLDMYRCKHCGGFVRPEITLMDEKEPEMIMADLRSSVGQSSCIVTIGVNMRNKIGEKLLSEAKAGEKYLVQIERDGVAVVHEAFK